MSRTLSFLLLATALFQLSSCGKKGSSSSAPEAGTSPFTGAAPFAIDSIQFDSTVTSRQQELIRKDLDLITRSNFQGDENWLALTNMDNFSNTVIAKWLTDRVHYIVGETYASSLRVAQSSKKYSPTVYSELFPGLNATVTVMSNEGAGAYLQGKENSKVYSMSVNGVEIPVKSPRVGIIKVGEGLFDEARFRLDSTAANISRIGTFFHEARHSDGNGANTAFSHAKCTEGTFIGDYACENYLNGPYVVQAVMLQKFSAMCTDCTSTEKTQINTMIADKLERLVDSAVKGDPRPEKIE